ELVWLNDSLSNINRREFWLAEKVVQPLKEHFDLIVMDCSPNWNKLTTNALVACDILVSPLECKINNFRNFRVFRSFLDEFKRDMYLDFSTIFVPTRFSGNRKLGLEIKEWYQKNLSQCTKSGIRESIAGEEATALYRSIVEHVPRKREAWEMRELIDEIWRQINLHVRKSGKKHRHSIKYTANMRNKRANRENHLR
ncbi:MAG: ParA family protein, partial [Halobacteriovoraceae bacterium]|nr:ParA family protein [Halobacteriovoraceae bacterium]